MRNIFIRDKEHLKAVFAKVIEMCTNPKKLPLIGTYLTIHSSVVTPSVKMEFDEWKIKASKKTEQGMEAHFWVSHERVLEDNQKKTKILTHAYSKAVKNDKRNKSIGYCIQYAEEGQEPPSYGECVFYNS